MYKILGWIKNNKLTFLLLLVVGYFLYGKINSGIGTRSYSSSVGTTTNSMLSQDYRGKMGVGGVPVDTMNSLPYEAAPAPGVTNRLVISESYLSLLVKNVREVQNQIIQTAESLGGYMVNANLNNPQDAPTSTLTVRVPSEKLNQALETFRQAAVKVVTENLNGQDVTDQFVDNEARLQTLENTKSKFQEIFDKATQVEDILRVQQELINVQTQIDSIKGQQNYLEKNAQMARLTIYLSTDELALPYAPSETWRPAVIFKQAVRSLLGTFRKIGTAIIWLAVYSAVIVPVLLLLKYFKRKF